jgi:Ca2+-binding EF-hand superfamily protein
VWSIGVIAYMLLSGTPPFYGRTDAETLNAVRLGRWQFDEYLFKPVSAEAKDFISKCLIRRPNARPSAKAALEHRWFNLLHRGQEQPQVSLQIIHRLDSYIKRTSLSKIIMDVVAHTLQPDQISDLREQFSKFDVSRSGEVTLSDLRKVMAGFQGFREEDLTLIFDKLNIDQTGKISYHEFLAATITRQNIKEENLQIAFERMSNHSDCITAADIKKLLGNTKYDVDKIMEEVGLQPDSKIRFHDVSALSVLCTVRSGVHNVLSEWWLAVVKLTDDQRRQFLHLRITLTILSVCTLPHSLRQSCTAAAQCPARTPRCVPRCGRWPSGKVPIKHRRFCAVHVYAPTAYGVLQ